MRKTTLIFLIGILVVASGCTSKKSEQLKSTDSPTITPIPSVSPPTISSSQTDVFAKSSAKNLGESATLKDFKYKVLSVAKTKTVGTGSISKTADGIYILLDVEVENVKKDSELMSSGNFKLKDSNDREFDVDTTATIYTGKGVFLEKIQPGIPKKITLAFEIPNDESLELKVRIREGLVFREEYEIQLGKLSSINAVTWSAGAKEFVTQQSGCDKLTTSGTDSSECDNYCKKNNLTSCNHIETSSPYDIYSTYECWCK